MQYLSKSRLVAYRQCPRRLWLEVHRPELRVDTSGAEAVIAVGHEVGAIARRLYDPKGKGVLIDVGEREIDSALVASHAALAGRRPVFEAALAADRALAVADVMLPAGGTRNPGWRMVEVKSAGSVKDYHRDDAAIQAYIALQVGLRLTGIAVAHIDTKWVYPGDGDYDGLLIEEDLTDEALSRRDEVRGWIHAGHAVVAHPEMPDARTGRQCMDPFPCGFAAHCTSLEPRVEYPVAWLPGAKSKKLAAHLANPEVSDMRDVPDDMLNAKQLRVKRQTLAGKPWLDKAGARDALASHKLPAYFLDFETIGFAVPIWKGTRPHQQIAFQLSCHRLSRTGRLDHAQYLDLTGKDPSRDFAQALIEACGERGPIFVYNKGFEGARIGELASRFPRMARALRAIGERLVDLRPIVEDHYYHPSQQGSWSIKAVLPAMVPELRYDDLVGVQNGGGAQAAYIEAIGVGTSDLRRKELRAQLEAYCGLDTLAMVRLRERLA